LAVQVSVFSAITRGRFQVGLARNFVSPLWNAAILELLTFLAPKAPKTQTIEAEQMAEAGRAVPQRTVRLRATLTGLLLNSHNLDLSLLTLTLHSSRLEFLFSFRAHASCDGSPLLARREAFCLRVYAPTSVRTRLFCCIYLNRFKCVAPQRAIRRSRCGASRTERWRSRLVVRTVTPGCVHPARFHWDTGERDAFR
jgi:hypothetical protein